MTEIKALIFDKDGTLFDFAQTWQCWADGFLLRLAKGDRSAAERYGQAIGYDLAARRFARDSIVIAGTPGEVTEALMPFFPDWTAEALELILNEEAAGVPQYPAVPLEPLFGEFLARGLRLGVATNDAEAPALAHLGAAGIIQHFDFIAGYDSGFGGKPAAGQLLAFASHVELAPAQIAMVGDSTHDLQAGRLAGMSTVAVLTGLAEQAELAPFADIVLPNIGGIPGWLDQRGT